MQEFTSSLGLTFPLLQNERAKWERNGTGGRQDLPQVGSRSPCAPQIVSKSCVSMGYFRAGSELFSSVTKRSLPNWMKNHRLGWFMIFSCPKTLWFLHARGLCEPILKLFPGLRGSPSLSLNMKSLGSVTICFFLCRKKKKAIPGNPEPCHTAVPSR